MTAALIQDTRVRMEHHVSTEQVLLSELLALPIADLEERVTAELDANPALELPSMPACPYCGRPPWGGSCLSCTRAAHREHPLPDRF